MSGEIGCGGIRDDTSGRGLIHIYCGNGKGKTTCSMGLIIRALGSGKKVLLHQFLKNNRSSERKILNSLENLTVIPGKEYDKFTFQMNKEELEQVRETGDAVLSDIVSKASDYDMVVMDEAVYAIDSGLLSEDNMIEFLQNKPESLEVVLTGRNPSDRLIGMADYVSEICKRKHPFDAGISARLGIEK